LRQFRTAASGILEAECYEVPARESSQMLREQRGRTEQRVPVAAYAEQRIWWRAAADGSVVADMGRAPAVLVPLFTSGGSVALSPCRRSAARTWAQIRARIGASAAAQVPT
jgi:hypothetical protein